MRLVLAFSLWVLTGLPTVAQDAGTAERMIAAFEGWMVANDAPRGTLAIRYKGRRYSQTGVGLNANTPMEMASLSKAITAVCIAELVREGRLSYADRFADLVDRGPDISVAQLLSHTSGLKHDSTQSSMVGWLNQPTDRANDVLDHVIERDGPRKKAGRYHYNNENYALLSLVIQAVSGASYQVACTDRVLTPAGAIAVRSPQAGAYLAWGGWQMSVDDYAAFLSHWFTPQLDPFTRPNAKVGGGAHYGQGMLFRTFRGGHNYWHHGALCFANGPNIGSFAVSWKGEWSAVAAYDICPTWDAMRDLDAALSGAVFQ
ncbi:serine hydrolase [Pseudosulfitobacter sp. SM2401]|uniref:serine hydrolase domain-containing protein n=1 Tax=Pseudosulfitobacter sp. SM2401 TaxID=3350098 RepID=UPI0036F26299